MSQPLFDPDRHEPLRDIPWTPAAASAAVERIVSDTRRDALPEGLWPTHPNDSPPDAPAATDLYLGRAGVIWALDYLAAEGAVPAGETYADRLSALRETNRAFLAGVGMPSAGGYLIAGGGILGVQAKLAPSPETANALASLIAGNTDDPALELMWGAPGTMLLALFMHRRTGEGRWADLFRRGADALERAFLPNDDVGAELWTQTLYGRQPRLIGAVHGFAGNAYVLWAGRGLLATEVWTRWSARLAASLRATAVRDKTGANWPSSIGPLGRMLAQHCHGAPGVVTSLALLDQPIDDLMLGGGELTWAAGPLNKGGNLCHGTGGNGYAFLKLFERTGDEMWLSRARAFAMHAIAQSDAEAAELGRRRYSLWTGDLGLAAYLLDCIKARARFPTLDVF